MKTFLAPLSPEEEKECIKRIENGDLKAKDKLILHNMRLVAHVAKKYMNSDEENEDLISVGTIGLIKAVGTFKSDYGSRFATYAIRCVDNEMLMYFRSRKKIKNEVSLFEPIGMDKEGNKIHLFDVLENDEEDTAEDFVKRGQILRIMENMEKILGEREVYIIQKRYGLKCEKAYTQREIAHELGISRSYVSRIEKRALEKMRNFLNK